MDFINRPIILRIFVLSILCGCNSNPKPRLIKAKERSSSTEYLYLRNGKTFGILRVECADCQMIYIVNKKEYTISIFEGNEDRFIYPKANSSVIKTVLTSNDNQMIRVLAIDPHGKVISNVLDTFYKGQVKKKNIFMQYQKNKNTVVIDISKNRNQVD